MNRIALNSILVFLMLIGMFLLILEWYAACFAAVGCYYPTSAKVIFCLIITALIIPEMFFYYKINWGTKSTIKRSKGNNG